MVKNLKNKILIALGAVIIIILCVFSADFYIDWLWFKSVNFQSVFITTFFTQILLRIVVGLFFFTLFAVNFLMVRQSLGDFSLNTSNRVIRLEKPFWEKFIEGRGLIIFLLVVSFFLAYIFSSMASENWMVLQQYLHASSFGEMDPIFMQDVGFYVFKLPFYQMIYNHLMAGFIVSIIFVSIMYLLTSPMTFSRRQFTVFSRPKVHLSILIAVFFLVIAWGYKIDTYQLLFSNNDVFLGAGYTDIHARLLAYQVLLVVSIICALAIIINLFVRQIKWVLVSITVLFITSLGLGVAYPSIVQKFQVIPNQLAMEDPYIAYNIAYTLKAYGLEDIKRQNFPAENDLEPSDLQKNANTVKNIRLWDWVPLQQTYSQLQEMRPYYTFKDIDVDRYVVNGEYRQVMLGVREIVQSKLPAQAQTWVNQKLKYTHGYGVAASPVNEVTSEGLPTFFLQNIPPETSYDNFVLNQPEVYYGEETSSYVIVNTKAMEFDYPLGDQNVETAYKAKNGIQLRNGLQRLIFAFAFGDYKMLLSNDLTSESQILYNRNIHDRVRKVAPFLHYDYDPYPVISGGKIYWIQDAYTVSNLYPYSEPTEGWGNYVRNSVKIVTDAYDGTMNFYVTDTEDPIIRSYQLIFPKLFRSLEEMPPDLRTHIRYPEDLFTIQAQIYANYHMQNTSIFYHKEDNWTLPEELVNGNKETIKPYYMIMQLPGEEQPEYLLMIPFTPDKRTNMVAWMAARSDVPQYGELLIYNFPKQKLTYGPMQIESRIDQDGEISKELSLWNQRGSSILRGNLLVIPMENSLLYVEPIYLQADQSKMPELRRVVVVYGDRVVMERNLDEALNKLFGPASSTPSTATNNTTNETNPANSTLPPTALSIEELSTQAYQTFQEGQSRLKNGDWAGYGESITQLEALLRELEKTANPAIPNTDNQPNVGPEEAAESPVALPE